MLLDQRMEGGVVKVVDVTIDLSPREIISKYKMDSHPTAFLGEVIFNAPAFIPPKERVNFNPAAKQNRNYQFITLVFSQSGRGPVAHQKQLGTVALSRGQHLATQIYAYF